jgi:DNA-directed RNA polymerase subunit omega
MLHPSYSDLMKVVNSNVEEGEDLVVNSRYSIVIATAKRARQIIAGDDALVPHGKHAKPLSLAVEELHKSKIHILPEGAEEAILENDEIVDDDFEAEELVMAEEEDITEAVETEEVDSAEEDFVEDEAEEEVEA